jgi:hypothetical protein
MQMSKMMSKLDKDLWQLRKFCRKNKISRDLTIRMKRYVDMVLIRNFAEINVKDVVLVPSLSKALRQEMQTELHSQKLNVHPFFAEIIRSNKGVTHLLCNDTIETMVCAREDVLFGASTTAHNFVLILSGSMAYIPHSSDHEPLTLVHPGSWCCEAVLWTRWVTQGHMHAHIESGLFMIDDSKFRKAVVVNGLVMPFVRRYGATFLRNMNRQLREKGMPSDLQMHFAMEVPIKELRKMKTTDGLGFVQKGTSSAAKVLHKK